MEVAIAMDFNFDSTCSSPYISAPSSPKRFDNLYFSAPTSPTQAAAFYREFNNNNGSRRSASAIPFYWEDSLGNPKSNESPKEEEDDDFEFDFSGQLERPSLTAEELFDGGKIRPLKPQLGGDGFDQFATRKSPVSSPRSSRFRDAFSPRQKKASPVPFSAPTRKGSEQERGRERSASRSPNSNRRGTRSLSPFRISEFVWEEEQRQQKQQQQQQSSKPSSLNSKPPSSSSSSFMGYRKWKLKDFLLFRSASEGRGTDKDPLRKYAVLTKKNDDVKDASFRSTESSVSVASSVQSSRRSKVSAHELHYAANRTVSAESKRKTFLPYKQGLLGCMGFNPSVHGLAKGISSITRG